MRKSQLLHFYTRSTNWLTNYRIASSHTAWQAEQVIDAVVRLLHKASDPLTPAQIATYSALIERWRPIRGKLKLDHAAQYNRRDITPSGLDLPERARMRIAIASPAEVAAWKAIFDGDKGGN